MINYLVLQQLVYDELEFELMNHRKESSIVEMDESDIVSDYQRIDRTAKLLDLVLTLSECKGIIAINSEYPIKKDKEEVFLSTIKTEKSFSAGIVCNTYSNVVGTPSDIIKKISEFTTRCELEN